MKLLKLALLFVLLSHACFGVMIRHDVSESKYLDLANQAGLHAGLVRIPDARGDFSGVLLGPRHILTCGHPILGFLPDGKNEGRVSIAVQVRGKAYQAEYAWLHPRYNRSTHCGGGDLAVLRLTKSVLGTIPARLFSGQIRLGQIFIGVGQGKSGTGKDNNEPHPMGTFRGYANTIDYLFDDSELALFRSDFDDGSDGANTLARIVYGPTNLDIRGTSSKTPLSIEGSPAAGDSGSGVFVQKGNDLWLVGITSYRYYSMYGGQAGFANLTHSANRDWLNGIARSEKAVFGENVTPR